MTLRPRLLFLTAFIILIISVIACLPSAKDGFVSAKELIVMRDIGHKILLSSGDAHSRVLPIIKTDNNQYQICFEKPFSFMPDSVIAIVQRTIEENNLSLDYLVNVVQAKDKITVYGFAVITTEQTNLLPCKGRRQPKADYVVNVNFRDRTFTELHKDYYLIAGGSLMALLLIFSGFKMRFKQQGTSEVIVTDSILNAVGIIIGNYKFYKEHHYLEYGQEQIKLSDKETKVLTILACRLNTVVERGDLQKVWEDDGVIVGRSLDMFVSKLRKKLERDSNVRLMNVHGKGYKLEVTTDIDVPINNSIT